MQFTKENAEKVMAGTKTQTRRVVKDGEWFDGIAMVLADVHKRKYRLPRCVPKWVVGKTYAVCPGRGKPSIGRIRLLSIRKEKLQSISEADILTELGITDPYMEWFKFIFTQLWDSINPQGKRWADNPDVWALTFEVVQ